MSTIAIIPARMASSRFPGKPLKQILGISMIEHVWRRAKLCKVLDEVLIATCDKEIAYEVERFGGKAMMTADSYESCVDRVAEAADATDADIVMNVQGDMPLVHPDSLEKLVEPLLKEDDLMFVDMMGQIEEEFEVNSVNVVKVVVDLQDNALYYSREPIPSRKKISSDNTELPRYKQFGINAFRRESLKMFTSLPRTPLEVIESVDMLRLLENGWKVRMVSAPYPVTGVDTPEDLERVVKLMSNDDVFRQYAGSIR